MAIFRLQINSISRTANSSATGAAAYRAGEKIRDERTGKIHNHSRRSDVLHKEILLPAHLSDERIDWARDRVGLWNAAELAESRGNARVAREIQVTLPAELPAERRLKLAREFAQEVSSNYNVAVDLSVHHPRPSGDPRNFHAHLLLTTREVRVDGLGAKAGLDMSSNERHRLGLPNASDEYKAIRARWAELTNEALREANIDARVDHRSLAEQGIDREPRPHIPFAAYQIERSGRYSAVAETLRAQYTGREQARRERQLRTASPDADREGDSVTTPTQVCATRPPGPASARDVVPLHRGSTEPPRSLEDIGREATQAWLRMRAAQTGKSVAELQGRESSDPKPQRGELQGGELQGGEPQDSELQSRESKGAHVHAPEPRGRDATKAPERLQRQVSLGRDDDMSM